jgi:hypothetical protein
MASPQLSVRHDGRTRGAPVLKFFIIDVAGGSGLDPSTV